jgi:hypothetical protein
MGNTALVASALLMEIISTSLFMKSNTPFSSTFPLLALAGLLLATAPVASAFPRTKEKADATLTFDLQPTAAGSGTAAGTATVDVTRSNGVSTSSSVDLTLTGLADGTYTVDALLKSDAGAVPVAIGSVVVPADPAAPALMLPTDLDPFDIATLTVSDATPAVVLSGTATEAVTSWTYFGNRPLVAAPTAPAATPGEHGGHAKKIHGHVLIQARIANDVETRRKFLLVGLGLPADTTLTVNLDGVAVGSVTTTPRGKAMLTSLEGDFRLAGVDLITLTDANNVVIAQADFFPNQE